MIIFNETQEIMRHIISASGSGAFEVVVDNGTTMTESTPVSYKQGTEVNPMVAPGSTVIINGVTVTLGQTSTNLNGIIADINDANIPGVVASKDSNYLVLTIEHAQQATWSYEIGNGTANVALGLNEGLYSAVNPTSINYFGVWQGTATDRALAQQMDQVIKYFSNLGFKIDRIINTNTNKTFKWNIYW